MTATRTTSNTAGPRLVPIINPDRAVPGSMIYLSTRAARRAPADEAAVVCICDRCLISPRETRVVSQHYSDINALENTACQ